MAEVHKSIHLIVRCCRPNNVTAIVVHRSLVAAGSTQSHEMGIDHIKAGLELPELLSLFHSVLVQIRVAWTVRATWRGREPFASPAAGTIHA